MVMALSLLLQRCLTEFVTSAEVPGCKLRILCFLFQFFWSGESFFSSDKYTLTAPCFFLALGRLNFRKSWQHFQLKEFVCSGPNMLLCPDRQVSTGKVANGGVPMVLGLGCLDSTALRRNFWSQSLGSVVTIFLDY
jgi:hypothetical protein